MAKIIDSKPLKHLSLCTLVVVTLVWPVMVCAESMKKAEVTHLTENSIIGYIGYSGYLTAAKVKNSGSYAYRKLVKITAEGSYLVQDFYLKPEVKYTDPYLIKEQADLINSKPTSIEGQITFYSNSDLDYNSSPKYAWQTWFSSHYKKYCYSYKNGQLEGLYTEWGRGGELISQGHFVAGKEQGLWIKYEYDGYKSQGMMHDGNKEGPWITLDPNGQIIAQVNYQQGSREGVYKTWYPYTLAKEQEGYYQQNQKQGLWLKWHSNGQLKQQSSFWDDNADGSYKEWDQQGRLVEEGFYQRGKKLGLWVFYQAGIKQKEVLYLLNDGVVTRYYQRNGMLSRENYIKNNNYNVSSWTWYTNGQLDTRTFRKNNQLDGRNGGWSKEGKVLWQRHYKEGKKISEEGDYYGY